MADEALDAGKLPPQSGGGEPPVPANDIQPIAIEEEMKRSYLDYAMSVIVSRALPDVRDGLKPVHRRILYAMKEGGYDSTKPYKKSARIVGDVMGKYHPHGDSAIYDAMVRMAQDFSMRVPLIDGQGNFGSMDGDMAAAMRYTEARLAKTAEALLEDIDKNTVDFQPNYDGNDQEPTVLPARYPNLLVNGAGGIAVGMATNIPPHNLGEVINACCAYIDNPEITVDELIEIVPGPDYPTGGIILGRSGIRAAYHTGRGSVPMRGLAEIEDIKKDKQAIVITEIPYQVNKLRLIERIAECHHEKIVEGITDVRDESDRDGVRIVVELRRDAQADIVLNQLYKHTPLQTSFGCNMLALHKGRPMTMTLRDMVSAFVDFREEVIRRRTEHDLGEARNRAHILIGLAVAVANIDEVIKLIRQAPDPAIAREQLMARDWPAQDIDVLIQLVEGEDAPLRTTYRLTETQAKAILDLRLHRLTGLERDKIAEDLNETVAKIRDFLETLSNRAKLMGILRTEIMEIQTRFATPRRTRIDDLEFEDDIESLIPREDMVVTVSHAGYIKRVPLAAYRAQKRGGKGRSGMNMRDEDFATDLFVADTLTPLLLFSSTGMVYKLKVYKLPLGNPQARGKALVNLLPLSPDEKITTVLPLPEDESTWEALDIIFATSGGTVRRNKLSDFENIRKSGLIAMKLEEGESLIGVSTCNDTQDLLLTTALGRSIRFNVDEVRVFAGRTSMGVRGIRLADGDEVISLSILNNVEATAEERAAYLRQASALRRQTGEEVTLASEDEDDAAVAAITLSPERFAQLEAAEQFILTVSVQGFGKRSSAYEYRVTGRGGQGIWNMKMGEKNTEIAASFPITPTQQIMLVSNAGTVIRMPVVDIRIAGRATQGVTLFRLDDEERVVSVAHIDEDESEDGGDDAGEDTVETVEAEIVASPEADA